MAWTCRDVMRCGHSPQTVTSRQVRLPSGVLTSSKRPGHGSLLVSSRGLHDLSCPLAVVAQRDSCLFTAVGRHKPDPAPGPAGRVRPDLCAHYLAHAADMQLNFPASEAEDCSDAREVECRGSRHEASSSVNGAAIVSRRDSQEDDAKVALRSRRPGRTSSNP